MNITTCIPLSSVYYLSMFAQGYQKELLVIVNLSLELISYPILIQKRKLEINHCLENVVHHRNAYTGSFSHGQWEI